MAMQQSNDPVVVCSVVFSCIHVTTCNMPVTGWPSKKTWLKAYALLGYQK